MTLHMQLPPELEERLRREAERQQLPLDAVAVQLLDAHLPAALDHRRAAAVAMLKQWMAEDAQLSPEEAAGNQAVLRMFDEDRLADRKLFTDDLQGHAS